MGEIHVQFESLQTGQQGIQNNYAKLQATLEQLQRHRAALRQAQQGFTSTTNAFSTNGMMEDPNVAPEHSAAMTLGMLSTGGLTPNPGNPYESRPYPASMGNILNDVPQQPSGLTPQYNGGIGNPQSGPENAPSPFSSLFGPSLGFQNIDLPSTNNIDWDAWDSYIQGPGLDQGTQASTWVPMDFGGLGNPGMQSPMGGMQTHHTSQPLQPQGQGDTSAFSGNAGVFMGDVFKNSGL